jgi:RNA polymerase sigma-70 factor (ECF subfamily)
LEPLANDEDRRDIAASLDGDERSFARLVARYEGTVASQMWRFSRDESELESLTQEVFVEAYFSLPGYKAKAPFLHWLRRIATRVGYRFWKRQARERDRRQTLDTCRADFETSTKPKVPSEAGERLFGMLELLPPKDRLVLTLLYFEELDTREIGQRLGWSRSLVKVRAFRARKKLKTMLEDEGLGGIGYARSTT